MSDEFYRYSHASLDTLKRKGVNRLVIWCVGRPKCFHYHPVNVDDLMQKLGPQAGLLTIARRARCHICGTLGAHVQPESPRESGMPRHANSNEKDMKWP